MVNHNYIKRLTVFLLFLLLVALLRQAGFFDAITLFNIKASASSIEHYIAHHYFQSCFLFLIIFVVATVFFIPITVLLTVAAGYFFGVFAGFLYALSGATIGSTALFLLVRYLAGDFVQNRFELQLRDFNKKLEIHGKNYLLMLQFLPLTPTFLINILAGLSKISLWTFVWTTAVGLLPGTAVYVVLGQQLHTVQSMYDLASWQLLVALTLLAILSVLPVVLKRKR